MPDFHQEVVDGGLFFLQEGAMAMKTRTQVAGIEDYQVALATYRAACERWPGTPITLAAGRAGGEEELA